MSAVLEEYEKLNGAAFDWQLQLEDVLEGRPQTTGITIDRNHARTLDDGFMIYPGRDGGWTVQVSIAHASAMVGRDTEADRRALSMGRDHLHNHLKVGWMLPQGFVRETLSLDEQAERPALTFEIKLDKNFDIADYRIFPSAFRSLKKCTRDEINEACRNGEPVVSTWLDVATGLYAKRMGRMVRAAEESISNFMRRPKNKDEPEYTITAADPAEHMVEEVMRLTNRVAADFLRKHNAPALFSPSGVGMETLLPGDGGDFFNTFARWSGRVRAALRDNAPPYVKATSPLRSYGDLVMQRQITNIIEGRGITYTERQLQDILSHIESAEERFQSTLPERITEVGDILAIALAAVTDEPEMFDGIPASQMNHLLDIALKTGVENPVLKNALVNKWLKQEGAPFSILERLLVTNNHQSEYWSSLRRSAAGYLDAHPALAAEMMDYMCGTDRGWKWTYAKSRTEGRHNWRIALQVNVAGKWLEARSIKTDPAFSMAVTKGLSAFWRGLAYGSLQEVTPSAAAPPCRRWDKGWPHLRNKPASRLETAFEKAAPPPQKNAVAEWDSEYLRDLTAQCRARGWQKPVLALREIRRAGVSMYFAGVMTAPRANCKTFESCGVALDPDNAIDKAAESLLQDLARANGAAFKFNTPKL